MKIINIGKAFEKSIDWMEINFSWIFDSITFLVTSFIGGVETFLLMIPAFVLILLLALLTYKLCGRNLAIFSLVGFFMIWAMGYWTQMLQTLTLIVISTFLALAIGIPIGVACSRSERVEAGVRLILDFMQTMPAFVYLIPSVLFFQLGQVPGVISTIIFSMPPAVRLTTLGIRNVSKEVVEAGISFGCSPSQLLFKVQLPLAKKTIFSGINQTIMLSLSMVVISAMIGAGGLGGEILKGITQLRIDIGFESGLAVVILAIFLDRITQSFGTDDKNKN